MKLTYAVWKLLPADVQTSFKKTSGDGDTAEYDNGEENAGTLKTALDAEKEEKRKVKEKLDGFEAVKMAEIKKAREEALEHARTSGDFKAVEDDYKRQITDLKKEKDAAAKDIENRKKDEAINKHVDELSKNFVSPGLAKAAIKTRLTAELVDGEAIVRVLDKTGKASAASVEDLKKEYLTDPELKGSLVASKGSGGGSGLPPVGGGSGAGDDSKFDAVSADPKAMIARLEAKGIVTDGEDD